MALPNDKTPSPLEGVSVERFKGKTYANEGLVNVLVTVTEILPNNPNRFHWVIANTGVNDVYLSMNPDVQTGTGYLLASHGGIVSMDEFEDGESVGYAVYGVAFLATVKVLTREVVRS